MTPYIVLYLQGGRIGSVELTQDNLSYLQSQLCLSLIQTDIAGTQHYHILSPKGKAKGLSS